MIADILWDDEGCNTYWKARDAMALAATLLASFGDGNDDGDLENTAQKCERTFDNAYRG